MQNNIGLRCNKKWARSLKSVQASIVILTVYNMVHMSPEMTLYASCMRLHILLSATHFI